MSFVFLMMPMLFIIFIFVIVIISASKGRTRKIKPNVNISSKYKDIAYQILSTDEELKEERRKTQVKSTINKVIGIIGFGSFFAFIILRNRLFMLPFIATIIYLIVGALMGKKSLLFTKVVPKIVKSYKDDLEYDHYSGIPRTIYNEARFELYDRYSSDDLIEGNILGNHFQMGEVHTQNEHRDSDGHTHYTTLFHGTFLKIELSKSYDGLLNIVNNKIKLFNRDSYITIDNEAFEKIYDVFTDDKIKAMRLLTPDVTSKMIDIYNETGLYCEIKIVGKFLYMRLYTGPLFMFNLSNPQKESEQVGYSIAVLDTVFKVVENFVSEMERFDV